MSSLPLIPFAAARAPSGVPRHAHRVAARARDGRRLGDTGLTGSGRVGAAVAAPVGSGD